MLDILQTTARPFPDGSNCTTSICGAGIADAFEALSALEVPPLVAPTLVAPADDATLPAAEVPFEWTAVEGADTYHLHVATDADFNDLVVNEAALTATTVTKTMPGDGDYYWRVRAENAAENGPWSEVWHFTVETPVCVTPEAPTLLFPEDGSTVENGQPTFQWSAVADATGYEIAIGLLPNVSDALIDEMTTETEFTPATPLTAGETYYWWVLAVNTAGGCDTASEWSPIWSFTVKEEEPVETFYAYLPVIFGSQE